MPKLLTLTDAAQRLSLTPDTLRQQIRNGSLKASKLGRDWFVSPSEIERYRQDTLGRKGRKPKS